jgi:hypothetical protein
LGEEKHFRVFSNHAFAIGLHKEESDTPWRLRWPEIEAECMEPLPDERKTGESHFVSPIRILRDFIDMQLCPRVISDYTQGNGFDLDLFVVLDEEGENHICIAEIFPRLHGEETVTAFGSRLRTECPFIVDIPEDVDVHLLVGWFLSTDLEAQGVISDREAEDRISAHRGLWGLRRLSLQRSLISLTMSSLVKAFGLIRSDAPPTVVWRGVDQVSN